MTNSSSSPAPPCSSSGATAKDHRRNNINGENRSLPCIKNGDEVSAPVINYAEIPAIKLADAILNYIALMGRDGKIRYISEKMAEELGYKICEIQDKDFFQFIDGDDEEFKKSLEIVFLKEESVTSRISYSRKNGAKRCVPVKIVPVKIKGDIYAFIFIDNFFELKYLVERERDERVKELKCLYLLSSEMDRAKRLEDLLLNVSDYITKGMQFSDACSTIITLDNREFTHLRPDKPPVRSMSESIFVQGDVRGNIIVNYYKDYEFLHEERILISSIAKLLGRATERFELSARREQYTRDLESAIQERVRELEQSRKRYKDLFDNAHIGIVISTPEGEIVDANRAFFKILKYPEDGSLIPHIIKDNIYADPDKRKNIIEILEEKGRVDDYEFELLSRDGEKITVEGSWIRFEENEKTYYEGILKDISIRKRLEAELRNQKKELEIQVKKRTEVLTRQKDKLMAMNIECKRSSTELKRTVNKLKTLFNAITDRVLYIDTGFNIQTTNQDEKEVGKKCYEVLFGYDKICAKCPGTMAIKRKKPHSVEVESENGWYQLQCYPVFDSQGNVDGVIEWAKDITREKNLTAQMLQADRLASLGQLVSGIAHEINNPNTFIQGNMHIIQEAVKDILPILEREFERNPNLKIARLKYPFFKEHINLLTEDMITGTERIKAIVADLKKFARKEENQKADDVDINEIIERSIRLVQNQVQRKAVITTSLADPLPRIKANTIGLEQVMVNLLINASDAIPEERKGTIHIESKISQDGDFIQIYVRDNGTGMDLTTTRQIFDPFFTTKRTRGGTGLGLSIAYRIIKEHNGDIQVESLLNKGTTFTIEIPLKEEEII